MWSSVRLCAVVNGNLPSLTERGMLISAPASAEGFKASARAQAFPFDVRAYPALADGYFYARSKNELTCIDLRKQP